MSDDNSTIQGDAERAERLTRIQEIVWTALWGHADDADDDGDSSSACTWEEAQEYEAEMGRLVPRTIHAAREIDNLFLREEARLHKHAAKYRDEWAQMIDVARAENQRADRLERELRDLRREHTDMMRLWMEESQAAHAALQAEPLPPKSAGQE